MIIIFYPFIQLFPQHDTTSSEYKLLAKKYSDASKSYLSSNHTLALKLGFEALDFSLKSKNDLLLSQNYALIAGIYQLNYENKKALDYYNNAIFHALVNKDYQFAHQLLPNIGEIHRAIGNYSSGLQYLFIADYYTDKKHDLIYHAKIYNRISAIYYEMLDYNKSLYYAYKSLEIAKDSSSLDLIADNQILIGANYGRLSRLKESLDVLLEAKKLYKKLYPEDLPYVLNNICQTYTWMGKYDEAIEAGLESYNQAIKDSIKPYVQLAANYLFIAYEGKGDLKNAYKFLLIANHWASAINANVERQKVIEKENKIKEYHIKSEIEDFQRTILQNDKIKELNNWIIILQFTFVVFAVSAFIIYFIRTKKLNSANKRLTELNDQTIMQKEEISMYADQLKQANASKNKFFTIIAHDIRAPFHSILGLTDILQQDYHELSDEDKKEMITMLHQSSNNIFQLLENLLKWSQTQTGTIQYKPTLFGLKPLIEEVVKLMQQNALGKNITLSFHYTEELSVEADKNMIDTVIRNLISNAIKFTYKNGSIDVILVKNGHRAKVVVKDSGVGLSKEDLSNIFSLDEKNVSKGTSGESGSGLGLILCKEFVEKNHGEMQIESELGKGSSFAFLLPVSS